MNFVYQIKELILDSSDICLIAISATPEFAAVYFQEYLNYILKGRLENKFDALETIFIDNVIAAIKDGRLIPAPGRRYWCYTRYITNALRIEAAARCAHFNTISLWSEENKYH